jgi:hypothetical protein
MATPNEIEIILHYHVSPERHPRHDAPAVYGAREHFLREGMIEPAAQYGEYCFVTTEKGRAYVGMLCATPFPVTKYVDPREGA